MNWCIAMNEIHEPDESANPNDVPSDPPKVIASSAILMDAKEVWIDHNGERYRLRVTRKGKLILQK